LNLGPTEIPKAGLPKNEHWVGDEIPVFGPAALSSYSHSSLFLQYNPSIVGLRAFISYSMSLLRRLLIRTGFRLRSVDTSLVMFLHTVLLFSAWCPSGKSRYAVH